MKAASQARVEPATTNPRTAPVRLSVVKSDGAAGEPGRSSTWLRLVRGWNDFFFRPADPTPLGFIRIFAGLMVLYVHLAHSYDLYEFFGARAWMPIDVADRYRHEAPYLPPPSNWYPDDPRAQVAKNAEEADYKAYWDGIHPDKAPFKGNFVWSAWFHVTDPQWMLVLHVTFLVIIFLFMIGFCTRITAVLTWLAAVSYINRSPETLFGQDVMMNISLIYLMIGPSGAALSVDRLISRFWRTYRALRAGLPAPQPMPQPPLVSANLALRLFQIHFCFIYLAAGTSKLLGGMWWDGTALWNILANYEFSPVRYEFFKDFLRYLSERRWLWEIVMTGGALFTLVVEIGFPFLVWIRKLRWVCLAGAVSLHTGIALGMGLRVFSLFMIVLLMAFIPVEAIHRLLGWLFPPRPRLQLQINKGDRLHARLASLVRAVDAGEQVEVQQVAAPGEPDDQNERMKLTTADGQVVSGYPLFEHLVRTVRLLWPMAALTWVPGLGGLGRAWYPAGAAR